MNPFNLIPTLVIVRDYEGNTLFRFWSSPGFVCPRPGEHIGVDTGVVNRGVVETVSHTYETVSGDGAGYKLRPSVIIRLGGS